MNIWVVEQGKLVLYRREGSCTRCGECCRRLIELEHACALGSIRPVDPDSSPADLARWEGWSAITWYGFWIWIKSSVAERDNESKCPHLDGNDCRLWGQEEFPGICRIWPVHPADIGSFPACGFRFMRVTDDTEVADDA